MDEENIPVLVSREVFENMLEAVEQRDGKTFEVDYRGTIRGTVTYCEATVYETDPHPDALTVGQEG